MMRITNAMMTSNTKNNINLNKLNEDRLNTQIATGQVISRPSEDPVVAIRALRLNTNLSQLNQYYKKNIPDAQAWLNVTETALKQTDQIFTNIKENLTAGASDTNTATDRQKILENLKGLRSELYASGNADYAERTVFTDYRTQKSLTFIDTDPELNPNNSFTYKVYETFDTTKALDTLTYVSTYKTPAAPATVDENTVTSTELTRIRLAYDNLDTDTNSMDFNFFNGYDPGTGKATFGTVPLTVTSIAGKTQEQIDEIYLSVTKDPNKGTGVLIPETGEIIFGPTAADNIKKGAAEPGAGEKANQAYFTEQNTYKNKTGYNKSKWSSGDLRPEHYFACTETNNKNSNPNTNTEYYNFDQSDPDPVTKQTKPDITKPNFQNKDMEVEVSFNQKITINTHANEVYTHDIGRDVDELISITQAVVDADEKVTALEKKLAAAVDSDKPAIQAELDAANKEYSLKKDKMQKAFSNALDTFTGYADRNNLAVANIGSMQSRLTVTKERVADQLMSFKELADANINAELTETSIDFANAKLALEAAQLAAGKIAQQTLLNYL